MPATCNDMKLKVNENGLCSNLVIDGNLMEENIKEMGKTVEWVETRLSKMGYKDISKLLLVICDNKEQFTVYVKDSKNDVDIFV